MKRLFVLAALAVALGTTPAQAADTGNWISYLQINGCYCDFGSFSPSATKYTVDPTGPQATIGLSKPSVTISTGNQTQNVQVAFTVNGVPVGSNSVGSGQQSGVYFTSAPIDLSPGLNLVAITTSDPSHRLTPTVVTVTIPYRPVVLTNTAAPAVSDTPQPGKTLSCSTGSWTADPAPAFTATIESSLDGQTWSRVGRTVTVLSTDAGRLFRCKVVADNGYTTSTVYSAPVSLGGTPPVTIPAVTTPTVTTPAPAAQAKATVTPTVPAPAVSLTSVQTATKAATTNAVKKYLRVHKPAKPIVVHRYTSWLALRPT